MVGIPAVRRNESADDLRIVDMLARLGLEAYATTGENHLTVFRCQREQHFFDPTIGTASGK